jgi:hypothetical protein
MALVRDQVNAMNVLGIRKLNHIPPHFQSLNLKTTDIDEIEDWIYRNLESRYYINNTQAIDDNNKLIDVIEIGLEDSKEITMLLLGCPYIAK